MQSSPSRRHTGAVSRHEALLYRGERGFLAGTVPFLVSGIDAGEPVLVVVAAPKIDLLRSALGARARRVRFADMREVGCNPARILPVWVDFAAEHGGRPTRGLGEPVYPGRDDAELRECYRHESLLTLALADGPSLWLRCPYDRAALDAGTLAQVWRHHPVVAEDGVRHPSPRFRPPTPEDALAGPLPPPPPGGGERLAFTAARLDAVRGLVARQAGRAGLSAVQVSDLVLAVGEVAANSVRHGGGAGTVEVWRERGAVVCEVRDSGHIAWPLAGRVQPEAGRTGGRGLWLANQLCDLVEVRSSSRGTVVRLRKRCPDLSGVDDRLKA